MFQRILSRVLFSFIAGFISVVVFHQAMLAIVTGLLVNAAWGLGTALLLRLQPRQSQGSRIDLPQE